MKIQNPPLIAAICLLGSTAMGAIEINQAGRFGLSSSAPGQVISSIEVQAGDYVVWSHSSNKKESAIQMTFGVSVAGTVVVDEGLNITDFGTDAGLSFTVLNAHFMLGESDPNPNSIIAYLEVPSAGTYDFWALSSANITASDMLYIVRAGSGQIALLGSDAEQWSGDEDTVFSLNYSWGTSYDSVAVIEAASALKGTITPGSLVIDWSNVNDGGDPLGYLPGIRMHMSGLTSGAAYSDTYNFTFDSASLGKNSGSVVGMALAEVGSSGGDTWKGFPVDSGYADTGDWMGWVQVASDPYIYSVSLAGWMYIPETQTGEGGAWAYKYN